MKTIHYKKGATVIVQNAINKGVFYVVKSGMLEVDSEHKLADKALSHFVAGDSFGMVSALTGHKYLASIFASTDAEILEIPTSVLGSYLKTQKALAIKMLGLYSKELRAIDTFISRSNQASERDAHPRHLLANADFYLRNKQPEFAAYALDRFIAWAAENPGYEEQAHKAAEILPKVGSKYRGIQWVGSEMKLQKNEILFLENEVSRDIYVIKQGSIRLSKIAQNQELVIAILGEGEIFGEMAFLDDSCRMASTVTDSKSVVMRFSKDNLFESVGDVILQKIFESLCRRIWLGHQRIVILRLKDPVIRLYAYLYNLIRDQDVRTNSVSIAYSFPVSLDGLKKMCGIGRVRDEKISDFLEDKNLTISPTGIDVAVKKRVEEKVAFFRTREGQISSRIS